jgi:glycerol-3-phosphate acyltransferase PlsY
VHHIVVYALIPLGAYLVGSIPFGLILCRATKGVDLREHGSRNIGATNAGRVCGWPFFVATFALDFGKGLGPVLGGLAVAARCSADAPLGWLGVAYGLGAILGHTFPLYVGFKGGKAVATSFGVFVALAPWAALIALGVWLVVFLPLRYVSLASMVAAVVAPIAYAVLHRDELSDHWPVLAFAAAIAVLVVVRHRANIGRLLAGTENRVGRKKAD